MPDLVHVTYSQTGKSTSTNDMGMRAMQARAFEQRTSQYLLIKAPPASGKSRALMFIGLDKIHNQGVDKVIVAVPERSIGGSFGHTDLSKFGFFADWDINPHYNLCTSASTTSKVKTFKEFLESDEKILICTHATLRFAYQELEDTTFDNTLLAIDEFHHVSADGDNVLGDVLRALIENSTAHIVAMTGSYFRGDSVPVLTPEDEMKFDKVSFNYYEQLNGYQYLKSLGIGYHFYKGHYLTAIDEVLDTDKKTIVHIPNVNSAESGREDKYDQVGAILDLIGEHEFTDPETGVIHLKRKEDGKIIKVADLVEEHERDKIQAFLRDIDDVDDIDIIIALGMAKEGFDWAFCEHALTVGYRNSLTEIVQIIGRCTRDSNNKTHAQFTNLIAEPDASNDQVNYAVNNMLKAITCSLLMEQVLAPNFKFKAKNPGDTEPTPPGVISIGGLKEPSTKRTKQIVETDLDDLKASILQDDNIVKASAAGHDPEVINTVLIPKLIEKKYPDLTKDEVEEIRQRVVVDSAISTSDIKEEGGKKFVRMADKFINIDELHIDLIDQVNPFQKAFEILSKSVNTDTLKLIQESIESTRMQMTKEEAIALWPKVQEFVKANGGRHPDINSRNGRERELAQCIIYLRRLAQEQAAAQGAS
ncbi:DEAD/DEAH box helicase [Vibrio parahaemolyticus]|uniref:DEAD/DEAH box helicase n=1 Tax=Vibrio parahaemolyticus TaxID=670 RepID=UPI00084AD7F8|nr:DEAD/DEAH box helicase family protein [Vibrio parahaemolyticus]OEB32264.1 ATP-dependent helicase [Vibrio parahaemolyticus]HCG9599760.1 DEAD/DEAH box helicase family protein [Vibrio parahaemolyticus]HCH0109544.1 DEAD/DEAH box helicase family protein [Vibrio parahaemolyticus]HCH0124834.1 DEAD/DEAH box helicase family protein [Vibrio parahaemolyticus]HCH0228594.1 DEAD/DEAH box helicase family protein [Vibrio parahaemolyticus]